MSKERKCPHCQGDLSRYEDPLAVKMLEDAEAKIASLSRKLGFACRSLGKPLTKEEYTSLEKIIEG